ncbi:MAG: RyR domain-containing protein [Vicinamibacterales bacterium]
MTPSGEITLEQAERVARVAHEANRAYCVTLGDLSQPAWDEAAQWIRSSAVNGVLFHAANPEAGPEASHQSWLKQKQAEGWVYGPEKDPVTRTHPCFRPYDELPEEQRRKDHLFTAIVRSLLTEV